MDKISETCSRCKVKPADFYCNLCEPFIYFCSHCDGYIHSLPSKREHIRRLIELNNKSLSPIRNSQNTKPLQESLDGMHVKFLEEIRRSHDREKQEIIDEIERTRIAGEDRVFNIQHDFEENNKSYIMNMQLMENEYNTNLQNFMNDKDQEILILNKINNDIDRKNLELSDQLEDYMNSIRNNKVDFNSRMASLEAILRQQEFETQRISSEYEKKFKFMSDHYNREREDMISDYEKNSEKYTLLI
jgi:hypothetical protein